MAISTPMMCTGSRMLIAPVLVFSGRIGSAHEGQAAALLDTCRPQAGQFIILIFGLLMGLCPFKDTFTFFAFPDFADFAAGETA